ncbi:SRPBCC family protein [Baekduia soli]|uniref:SRPBCC family protein n=1 Tax=Baekduia soli TaxID=496014 RepID=UPI001E4192A4|nr:SRPBCC family protein [Baekduia soli]
MVVVAQAGQRRAGEGPGFVHGRAGTVPGAHAHLHPAARAGPARPPADVFPFFADARNLEAITPPILRFEVITPGEIPMRVGTLIQYRLTLRGIGVNWLTSIQEWDPPHRFVDTQVRGPYALWHHTHDFEEITDAGPPATRMTDTVRYAIGFGPLGELAARGFVHRDVAAIFDYRRETVVERMRASGVLDAA